MVFTYINKNSDQYYRVLKSGKHIFFLHNYSGKLTINIQSSNAEVYIFGLYIGTSKDQFKLNTIQHHMIGNSISDLLIKGVFFDSSKFMYQGLIRIDKNAQKTNAYQKNQNLILSDKVFVDSRPFLEILANDVRCTHGSTTGKINKEQSFYIQSRGISEEDSRRLIIEGFIEEVFQRVVQLGGSEQINIIRTQVLQLIH
ncbi:hypothetical protein A3H80_01835 [Candidatus Roizmanbacteria bacterium RIFCSPLOWO2_02_FULL_37_19]|uniref:SUF system FeS cluster assembly SufBD core domain-containing protein n=1 Tax=Candidatus Roizmanbacteria bacterium RIFCSPHIGHO2_02_FULL_37_24 TaxID=1802037 RepID=A0A1F7GXE1_9BACT|nr:MAG: hypothetical protein A2862_02485 [Candidatus Roizmanbacteria bacterium RIFCSPHIGHO2_01_FULL_38_41]OGK23515.1 MAG: hypothetical protein A3C24_01835 [Candidatus Roizmanbacteria bacterium RIFCSPHIGHO2_02_FULL_37_24]OGK54051.1 MAG: hypothetical protein A3H80_01835 [Candidatus Roizmanbacteria bacterium RIFCSPLOWO2_02_FULL_37_19]OGK60157.1 MAG: hypothetical protein A3G65_01765 [Candidatus Roizmanbacteria bacterium RIFCSPLOWO2_12_FULL_37_7b]